MPEEPTQQRGALDKSPQFRILKDIGIQPHLLMITMEAKEKIVHETGNKEAWICVCGNTPLGDGFFPCDEQGNEVEPAKGWNNLYVCVRCGRIVNQDSLEVVGQNPSAKLLR